MLQSIQKKINTALHSIPAKAWYALIIAAMLPAYIYGRGVLIDQSTSFVAVLSQVTVNFIAFLYIVGVWVDKLAKKKKYSRIKGWLLWAVVMAIVIMFFKYVGGMETRF